MRRSYVSASSVYAHLFEEMEEFIKSDMEAHKSRICWRFTLDELAEQVQGRLRRYIIRGRPEVEHQRCLHTTIWQCLHTKLIFKKGFDSKGMTVWVALWNDWRVVTNGNSLWIGDNIGVLSAFFKDTLRTEGQDVPAQLLRSSTQRKMLHLLNLDEEVLFC